MSKVKKPPAVCPYCGQECTTYVNLAMHISAKHKEFLADLARGREKENSTPVPLKATAVPHVINPPLHATTPDLSARAKPVKVIGEQIPVKGSGPPPILPEKGGPSVDEKEFMTFFNKAVAEQKKAQEGKQATERVSDLETKVDAANVLAKDNAEKIGATCEGIECVQQAVAQLRELVVQKTANGVQQDTTTDVETPSVPQDSRQHDHVAAHQHRDPSAGHITNIGMARGVLKRLMSCEYCSNTFKAAMREKLSDIFPDLKIEEIQAVADVEFEAAATIEDAPESVETGPEEAADAAEEEVEQDAREETSGDGSSPDVGRPADEEAETSTGGIPGPASSEPDGPTSTTSASDAPDTGESADDTSIEPTGVSGPSDDESASTYDDPLGFV